MLRRSTWLFLLGAVIVVTALYHSRKAWATPANSGFAATTLAKGTLAQFEVFNHFVLPNSGGDDDKQIWLSWQKTKGASDLYVQSNVWQPGGSTGWHSHPGHSLIVVTAGTVSDYEGDDPTCTPHVYTAGMSFVDHGGSHVHIIRNESTTAVAQTIAVQLIPSGQPRRIDAPAPGNCPF
jgi:quercetin dioxygenase-like cupin family protein